MYEDLNAIQDVTLRVVGIEGFISRHVGIRVVVLHAVVINDNREGAPNDLIIYDCDYLSLRKDI